MRNLIAFLPAAVLSGCVTVTGPVSTGSASVGTGDATTAEAKEVERSQPFGLAFEIEAERPFCVHDLAWRMDGVLTPAPQPWHRQFCTQPESRDGRTAHVARLALGVTLPARLDRLSVHFRRHPAAPLRKAEFEVAAKLAYKPGWQTESLAVVITPDDVKLDRVAVRVREGSSLRSTVRERIDVQDTRRDGEF